MIVKPPKGALLHRGHPMARDLVGAWLLNEGSGSVVFDASGSGHTAVLASGTAQPNWSSSPNGPCLLFDGGDYAQITGLLLPTTQWTISVWVMCTDTSTFRTFCNMYITDGNDERARGYLIGTGGNIIDDYGLSPGWSGVTTSVNTWYRITLSYDYTAQNARLYVDNIPVGTDTSFSQGASATCNMRLGIRYPTSEGWVGCISDVLVYSRALNASEILTLCRDPYQMFQQQRIELYSPATELTPARGGISPVKPPKGVLLNRGHPLARDLVGAWLLNEGSGGKVMDLSGRGRTGTIYPVEMWFGGSDGPCVYNDGTGDGRINFDDFPVNVNTWTVSFWYQYVGVAGYRAAFDAGITADTLADRCSIWLHNTTLKFTVTDDYGFSMNSSTVFVTGNWYNITVTYDYPAQRGRLYINGVKEVEDTSFSQAPDTNWHMVYGAYTNNGSPANGNYGSLYLWERALSDSEVLGLYHSPYQMFQRQRIELYSPATELTPARGGISPVKPPKGVLLNRGHPLARGLIGSWLMNEGGGFSLRDRSGYAGDGTISTAAWTGGNHGPCLSMNGSTGYVTITDKDLYTFSDDAGTDRPFSIVTWLNPINVATTMAVVSKHRTGGSYKFEWQLITVDSRLGIQVTDHSSGAYMRRAAPITGLSATWIYAVATYDGSKVIGGMKVYLNGVQADNHTTTSGSYDGMENGDTPVQIGANSGNQLIWNGRIGLVQLYDRVLSAGEVTALYRDSYQMFRRQRIELWVAASGGAPPSGDIDKVGGVSWANVGKVGGVSKADIDKIGGVQAD